MRAGALLLLLAGGCREVARFDATPARGPAVARWAETLPEVVTADGRVDYDRLEARRGALDDYVASLAAPFGTRRDHPHHGLWIDAFNALALWTALEHGRPASIDDVSVGWPWPGHDAYRERAWVIDGYPQSMWEIRNEHLRGKVVDWRDHAALHDPWWSAPPLRAALYEDAVLGPVLADQTQRWLRDPDRGVAVDGDVAVFPETWARFGGDITFQNPGETLCEVASRFVVGPVRQRLVGLANAGCPHRFRPRDPRLDDASGAKRAGPAASPPPVRRRPRVTDSDADQEAP